MSDSSSSDGEESRFKGVCDPTLWRTADEEGAENSTNFSVQAGNPQTHHNHSSGRKSFLLLQKIKTALAASQTKIVSPWMASQGSGTHRGRSREVHASVVTAGAPSTLSPYLAKQLAIRLDRNVGYYSCEENRPPINQEFDSTKQQSFHLLKNLSLIHQESQTEGDKQRRKRRVMVSKRLSYYTGSDEELKTRCSSVAVTPEWILAGGEFCPWPHPKNIRYIEEYKVKERRSDGSIIAVPSSASDFTFATKSLSKRNKNEVKKCVSEKGNDSILCEKEKAHGFRVDHVKEHSNSNVKTQRKQTRKRGKKKK